MDQLFTLLSSAVTSSTAGTATLLTFAALPIISFALAIAAFVIVVLLVKRRATGALYKVSGVGGRRRGRSRRR